MKECRAEGIYGMVCRRVEECLLLREFHSGDPDANPELTRRYGCPKCVLEEMERGKGKHAR